VSTLLTPAESRETLPTLGGTGSAVDFPTRETMPFGTQDSQHKLRANLLKYLSLAFKHKYLIAALCLVFLLGGFVKTATTPKIYSASTSIKIDRSVARVVKVQQSQDDTQTRGSEFYQTQYELIKSRKLAEQVATELNLAQQDFVDSHRTSLWDSLLGGESTGAVGVLDAAAIRQRHEVAVGKIMGGLSVQPVLDSSIVRIRFTDTSPAWAQSISIGVAEQFEKMTLDMRYSVSKYARGFLGERLQEQKIKLEASEKQLIEYAQKEGILDADNKQPQVMTELQGVQNAYAGAVTTRLMLEEAWNQAQADGGASLPQVMTDGLIQGARGKLAQLRATYQDRLTVVKPEFPEMIALQTQINSVEKDIRTQINLIKNSIKSQYDAAVANEKALAAKVAELKAAALDLRGRSVDYTILSREVDTNRSLYDGLLQQFRELSVVNDAESNNVSILDRAQLPGGPDSPSLSKNLALALLLGLAASIGAVWLLEILDDTFKTPEDMEEKLGLPVLGIAPFHRDSNLETTALMEVMNNPAGRLGEAFRSLRTAVQFTTSEGAPRSMLVTSSQPGEGKSTTAACLALNFGQLGMRVLLIDADMRNPSQHKMLKLDNSSGLSNYLSGASSAGDEHTLSPNGASKFLKESSLSGVAVMTSGPMPPNPAELLAGPRFGTLLATAAEYFGVVIIDGPPIMGLADAPILARAAEATIIVVEGGKTARRLVRDALKRLYFARAKLIGGFLSKYNPKHSGGYYGYGDSYAYAYGYGAGDQPAGRTGPLAPGQAPQAALSSPHDDS
jgi:succinoglycan biosynthesis transport protein ExoP